MTKISLVQQMFNERESKEYKKRGSVRAFAVRVNSGKQLLICINTMHTPNTKHFLHYLNPNVAQPVVEVLDGNGNSKKGFSDLGKEIVKNAINCIKNNKKYVLFNEDAEIAYPIDKKTLLKKYPSIKIFQYKNIKKL